MSLPDPAAPPSELPPSEPAVDKSPVLEPGPERPQPVPVEAPRARHAERDGYIAGRRIEYLTALRFPLTHPEWFKNVVIVGVFWLIPVLQTPLLIGYMFEITEMLHRRQAAPYPLFSVRRFTIYVTRGIWGYLLGNLVAAILGPVIQTVFQSTWFGSIFALRSNQETATIVLAIVIPLIAISLVLLVIGLGLVMMPLMLRAGLTQDFALTFHFRFVKDFIRRMWLESLLVNFFMFLASLILVPLGCALFCYGGLAALAYLIIVSAHFYFQLYELYLARGGEPIPFKPLPADVPPVTATT